MGDKVILTSSGDALIETAEGRILTRSASVVEEMYRRELLPTLRDRSAIPDGVKFLELQNSTLMVVHQQPPLVRLLQWSDDNRGNPGTHRTVRLSLPYVVTITRFASARLVDMDLYFSNKPLVNLGSPLGYPTLPNIYDMSGYDRPHVCFGSGRPTAHTWQESLGRAIDYIWNSKFGLVNRTIVKHSYLLYASNTVGSVEKWETNSRDDPRFGLTVDWTPAGTVRECMDRMMLSQSPRVRANVVARIMRAA